MLKKFITRKKEAMSGGTIDMICLLITLVVIVIFTTAQASINYDLELKKSIERTIDTYTYTMESNGGLSAAEQANLIAQLKGTYDATNNIGVTDVVLSGSALYGNAGQASEPNGFNEPMELTVTCTCNVYITEADAWNSFSNEVKTATTTVKRRTISHGIY